MLKSKILTCDLIKLLRQQNGVHMGRLFIRKPGFKGLLDLSVVLSLEEGTNALELDPIVMWDLAFTENISDRDFRFHIDLEESEGYPVYESLNGTQIIKVTERLWIMPFIDENEA